MNILSLRIINKENSLKNILRNPDMHFSKLSKKSTFYEVPCKEYFFPENCKYRNFLKKQCNSLRGLEINFQKLPKNNTVNKIIFENFQVSCYKYFFLKNSPQTYQNNAVIGFTLNIELKFFLICFVENLQFIYFTYLNQRYQIFIKDIINQILLRNNKSL